MSPPYDQCQHDPRPARPKLETPGRWQLVSFRSEEQGFEARRKAKLSRIEMMRSYAETRECRRKFLLQYFGENLPGDCGNCDRCLDPASRPAPVQEARMPFPVNSWVLHTKGGRGIVERYEGEEIVVLFAEAGSKTLALAAVLESGILTAVGV